MQFGCSSAACSSDWIQLWSRRPYLLVCRLGCVPMCLLACLPVRLLDCLLACSLACLLTFLFACLLICCSSAWPLLACLLTCFLFVLVNSLVFWVVPEHGGSRGEVLKNGCDRMGAFCGHQACLNKSTCLLDNLAHSLTRLLACSFVCSSVCLFAYLPVLIGLALTRVFAHLLVFMLANSLVSLVGP